MRSEHDAIRRNVYRQHYPKAIPSREELESTHGQVWSEEELKREFTILGQLGPFVGVIRRADGRKGSVQLEQESKLYHSWTPQE